MQEVDIINCLADGGCNVPTNDNDAQAGAGLKGI